MNRCVYVVNNLWDNPVGMYPQFVRRLDASGWMLVVFRFLSQTAAQLSAQYQHGSPQENSSKKQWSTSKLSASPQSLLLLLLFIYKKGQ